LLCASHAVPLCRPTSRNALSAAGSVKHPASTSAICALLMSECALMRVVTAVADRCTCARVDRSAQRSVEGGAVAERMGVNV